MTGSQRREREKLLKDLENRGWRITKGKNGYYRVWCPCPGKHQTGVHLTPSDPNYWKHRRAYIGGLCKAAQPEED